MSTSTLLLNLYSSINQFASKLRNYLNKYLRQINARPIENLILSTECDYGFEFKERRRADIENIKGRYISEKQAVILYHCNGYDFKV